MQLEPGPLFVRVSWRKPQKGASLLKLIAWPVAGW